MSHILQAHWLKKGGMAMTRISYLLMVIIPAGLAALCGAAISAQDKYTVQVPGGLSFAEFKGYEDWETVSVSKTEHAFAAILANPVMIEAYRAGVPGNGKPFPDGSKIAKIHWKPVKSKECSRSDDGSAGCTGRRRLHRKGQQAVRTDPDSGGWGYAAFNYDAASDTFTTCDRAGPAAAGERRQVRGRLPHVSAGKGLHFHDIREEVIKI